MELQVGQYLDRYLIQALLGEGGMGAVYKARDPRLAREVAIKVMHSFYASQPDFQKRFLQEACTAAQLDYSGIVKVYDSGQANGILYIVMEFLPGENLRKLLARLKKANQWLLLDEAAQLVRQVCLSIDYAHKKGILYRDIKPDNIMFKNEPSEGLPYRPVLTDLGLAKLLEGIPITREGETLGTPAYMSPEQAIGQATDVRSDVYSLGILLYELGVGRLPFEVKTLTEAIRCHTKEPPPSPRFLRPDLPVSLEGVILKALQKDPGRRYPDALSMANAIQEALPMKVTAEETGRKTEEGVVSLFTHYQPSLVESVSVSSEPGFPIPPADLAYDRILVMSAEHTIRTVLVKGKTLKIGREEDNDIVLDDMSVSRHHALVEFDGSQYLVTDLKSTNGIYQEGAKFLPGIAEVWSVGKTIRIGDYWLRLERSQRVYQRVVEAKAEPTGISTQVEEAGSQQQVIVRLEAAHLQVDPGKEVVLRATLLQRGAEAESFQLSLLGIPAEWLSEPLPAIQLMPGEGKLVQLVIRPPLSPQSRVGDYPLTLHVASQDRSAEPVSANASLQVNPFYQYQAGLQPETASGEREACYVVRLDNQGNANLTFQLNANDPEDVCQYHFSVQEVQLSPDQHQEVELKVALRQPISPGSARSHSFTVTVTPVEATNQTQSLHGVFQVLAPVVRREEKIPTPVQSAPAIPRPENVQSPWGKTPIWKSESPTEAAASPKASGISNFQFVIAWLFMIAVWAIIPRIINGFFWDTLCGYCILDWFMGNTEGIVKMVLANPQFWASLGIGPLVGLGTGISLRIILPTFSFGQMIKASIVWLFALILPVLIPVILPPFDYGPNPWLLVLLIGAAGGAFGGLVTARLIRTPESPLNSTQILSIILGWAIGLGILHLTSWLVADHGIQVNILMLNAIPVVIGGTWMIYQIYRLQSCFIPLVTPRAA